MAEQTTEQTTLVSNIAQEFKEAILTKASYTERWMNYLNAWNNSLYEDTTVASYRSNQSSNFIFSTIESMRPIMFDGNPKFQAIPVTAEAMPYSQEITQVLDYEWHRTKMRSKTMANSIHTLAIGNSMFMLTWNGEDKDEAVDGNVNSMPVSVFNIYPDPLATTVEDAEYIIYASYMHQNVLKAKFPEHAENISGADIQYSELVNYRNEDATIAEQVLVLEAWMRDYSNVTDVDETGVETKRPAFPLGRVITCAPDLNLMLDDKPNPYETGRFPFFLFKDIEVPFQFWGEGEVRWLLSPQEEINDLSNQIIDNAKHTANQIWIVDKNAGIPVGQLTNRPGLVVRKNPGTEVKRDAPPAMPMYVSEKINSLKSDIEVISGVHDVTRGQNPSGIESGTAIMALQEAAQTRIRLKLNLHEEYLADLGQEWLSRMKQFWKFNRLVAQDKGVNAETGQQEFDFIEITTDKLTEHYRVKVIGASTAQDSPASMLDQMIKLAQIPAEDGMPMVTREAVLDFLPKVNKDRIMHHFKVKEQEALAAQQAQQTSQDQMTEVQGIMGEMAGGMQGLNKDLGGVQDKMTAQDDEKMRNELQGQGYEMGMKEGIAGIQQAQTESIPNDVMAQMDSMSDEELAQFIQENPQIADMM